ncbi:MAG: DUF2059 domain-containing protein [Hyphomicrobiaceae bacterium]
MRLYLSHLLVLFGAVVGVLSVATSADARRPMSAVEIVRLTGFDRALDDVATSLAEEGVRAAAEGHATGDSQEFILSWASAAKAAFAPEKLKAALADRMADKLSEPDLFAIEDFFKGKLGKAMVAREVGSATPEAQRDMMAKADGLMRGLQRNPKRAAALVAVADAIRLREASVEMALNMLRAVMIGLAAADTSQLSMPLDVIEEQIEAHRASITAETEMVIMTAMAYTYRTASIADLNAYAKFLSSPPGKRFFDVSMKGLDAVLSEAGMTFGTLLMQSMGRMPI